MEPYFCIGAPDHMAPESYDGDPAPLRRLAHAGANAVRVNLGGAVSAPYQFSNVARFIQDAGTCYLHVFLVILEGGDSDRSKNKTFLDDLWAHTHTFTNVTYMLGYDLQKDKVEQAFVLGKCLLDGGLPWDRLAWGCRHDYLETTGDASVKLKNKFVSAGLYDKEQMIARAQFNISENNYRWCDWIPQKNGKDKANEMQRRPFRYFLNIGNAERLDAVLLGKKMFDFFSKVAPANNQLALKRMALDVGMEDNGVPDSFRELIVAWETYTGKKVANRGMFPPDDPIPDPVDDKVAGMLDSLENHLDVIENHRSHAKALVGKIRSKL